jgi:hypothetical protein
MKDLTHIRRFNESEENLNISDVSESKIIRGNNFIIDISDFEKLSREVGYYNAKSNIKDEDGEYDEDVISKYEKLREDQLDMLEELIKFYSH